MRQGRVFILIFTAFTLLASMFAVTDAGANEAASLSAGDVTVETGQSVAVPITWSPGSLEVQTLSVKIAYDASVITVDSCTVGPMAIGPCGLTTPGLVEISTFSLQPIIAGTFADLELSGQMAGTSALDLSIETITDGMGLPLNGNTFITDGSVTVEEPEPEPEPEPDRRKRWRRIIRRMWMRWLRACYFGHWNGW